MTFDREKLRRLRIRQGYSQQDLADKAKVAPRTVRDAESGKRVPRGYNRIKIAEALGCTPADLISEAL